MRMDINTILKYKDYIIQKSNTIFRIWNVDNYNI